MVTALHMLPYKLIIWMRNSSMDVFTIEFSWTRSVIYYRIHIFHDELLTLCTSGTIYIHVGWLFGWHPSAKSCIHCEPWLIGWAGWNAWHALDASYLMPDTYWPQGGTLPSCVITLVAGLACNINVVICTWFWVNRTDHNYVTTNLIIFVKCGSVVSVTRRVSTKKHMDLFQDTGHYW